jgi:hypothetical protein
MTTVDAALAVLGNMDREWNDAYEAALSDAVAFVAKLPLVRVVVPEGPRKGMETDDTLRDGKLLPRHKSNNARDQERRLAAADGVYFHAGRTHPAYGKVALVLHPLEEEEHAEVTPFGLGGLLCKPEDREDHEQKRSCILPVSHREEAEQVAFVAASTWRSRWREQDQAPQFIAAYFGSDLGAYFAADDTGRPGRLDPAGVFDSTAGSRDWRAWTFEVRIAAEIDLHRVLDSGRVMMWAMERQFYEDLFQRVARAGEPPWWFSKLMRSRIPRIIGRPIERVLKAVDVEVKKACLP